MDHFILRTAPGSAMTYTVTPGRAIAVCLQCVIFGLLLWAALLLLADCGKECRPATVAKGKR